jgi:hypothetical protein
MIASAARRKDKVDLFFFGKHDALLDKRKLLVGSDAAQFEKGKAPLLSAKRRFRRTRRFS